METNNRCFVFRINYGGFFSNIRDEIIQHGLLRQGWGASGMRLDSEKEFIKGWIAAWGKGSTKEYMHHKYINHQIMKEIKPGDYIIVPHVSLNKDYPCDSFLVARCKSAYQFLELEGVDDFCHVIELEDTKFSCSYHYDDDTQVISKKFRSYQSPLNRVWNKDFIASVEKIVEKYTNSPDDFERNNEFLNITREATRNIRNEYLEEIRKYLGEKITSSMFEKIITILFQKNGYKKIDGNWYDRKGGDVDIVFSPYADGTLMRDLYKMTNEAMPLIYVQAKKKWGTDENAIVGVNQLIQMKNQGKSLNPTLILINLTDKFPEDAKTLAAKHHVILINGLQFADLLVRYGIDIA